MKNFAKRISALVLAVVVSAAVLCPAAFAAQLPSLPKDQCVVDGAGVLSSSTVQTITELNAQLESSCSGAQIGVLTVEYTGNDSTEDYATQAFNAWGIGSSSNNNGVLILLVMESAQYADGDYYLTYGDGFRNTTLAKQSSAIAQTMEDQFAAKDYDGAVTTCARNVANTIADIYGVSLSGGTGNGSTVQPGYQGGQSSGGFGAVSHPHRGARSGHAGDDQSRRPAARAIARAAGGVAGKHPRAQFFFHQSLLLVTSKPVMAVPGWVSVSSRTHRAVQVRAKQSRSRIYSALPQSTSWSPYRLPQVSSSPLTLSLIHI